MSQSPAEPGRGDVLARQERSLKAEITALEEANNDHRLPCMGAEYDRRQERLKHCRAELSRLRNGEGVRPEPCPGGTCKGAGLTGITCPDESCDIADGLIAASPSDLPARDAIEVATWMLEHSYTTGHGDTVADMLGELEAQAKERAAPPSQPEGAGKAS